MFGQRSGIDSPIVLWRGRALAFTVGSLAVLGALAVFLYAQYLTPHSDREDRV